MSVANPPYIPRFGAGTPVFNAPQGSVYYDTAAGFAPYIYFGGWNALPSGGAAGALIIPVVLDDAAPLAVDPPTNTMFACYKVTTDGSGNAQGLTLNSMPLPAHGEGAEYNGYVVSVTLVTKTNVNDKPYVAITGGATVYTMDNNGTLIGQASNAVGGPSNSVSIKTLGSSAIFVWWDFQWIWINPSKNTDNVFNPLVGYIPFDGSQVTAPDTMQIRIAAGNANAGGNGADMVLSGGNSTVGTKNSGGIFLKAGLSNGGDGGIARVQAGDNNDATHTGGNAELLAGGGNVGGNVNIKSGSGLTTNGDIILTILSGAGTPGNLKLVNIPTSNPGVSGAVWSNAGVLTIVP